MRLLPPALRGRAFPGGLTRRLGFPVLLLLAAFVASEGCGGTAPGEAPSSDLNDNSGLTLPPGFEPARSFWTAARSLATVVRSVVVTPESVMALVRSLNA